MYTKVYSITSDPSRRDELLSHYDSVITPAIRESAHHVGHQMVELEPGRFILASNYTSADAAQVATGKDLYYERCAACHGADVASGGVLPDLRRASADTHAAWDAMGANVIAAIAAAVASTILCLELLITRSPRGSSCGSRPRSTDGSTGRSGTRASVRVQSRNTVQ